VIAKVPPLALIAITSVERNNSLRPSMEEEKTGSFDELRGRRALFFSLRRQPWKTKKREPSLLPQAPFDRSMAHYS
jgi:hypothetical protein